MIHGFLILFGYLAWNTIGMVWSMALMQRIAWQFKSKQHMIICFILNWLLWPIGVIFRYRRIQRQRKGEGRIVF